MVVTSELPLQTMSLKADELRCRADAVGGDYIFCAILTAFSFRSYSREADEQVDQKRRDGITSGFRGCFRGLSVNTKPVHLYSHLQTMDT